jgi:hypothetical protein
MGSAMGGGGGGGQVNADSAIMGGTIADAEDADEKARKARVASAGAKYGGGNRWSTGMENKAAGDQGGFPTQGGGQQSGGYPQYGTGFTANWWDQR